MIDDSCYWTRTGALNWGGMPQLEEVPGSLWLNGNSTYHGQNDRILQSAASQLNSSLMLIRPEVVTFQVLTPGENFGNLKRAVRSSFKYMSSDYNLKVTDPAVEQHYLAKPNGDYKIEQDLYFCVSLTEAHTDGHCYKLVAAVFSEHPF